jgi:hypothetical protein
MIKIIQKTKNMTKLIIKLKNLIVATALSICLTATPSAAKLLPQLPRFLRPLGTLCTEMYLFVEQGLFTFPVRKNNSGNSVYGIVPKPRFFRFTIRFTTVR